MPSLAELSDYYPQQDNTLPVESAIPANIPRVYINTAAPAQLPDMSKPITDARPEPLPEPIPPQTPDNSGIWSNVGMAGVDDKSGVSENPIVKKLFGLGGEERYQTWPEKVVREALAAPHDTLNSNEPVTSQDLIAPAQAVSALAGTGGLAGADASLGSTAFLRPALKYENKIYKAPIGGQHLDALPAHLAEDFQTKAMNGEDINHYNFGFMNHKGQFLDREKALDYAIKEGLVDQSAGQYGALTSTLMADSSKPGTAIEAMAKSNPFYSALEHNVNAIQQGKMTGDQWLGTLANKPGVKPEELDWTGTKEFLQSKGNQPVTKAELQEHLQDNKVELKEVDKGAAKNWEDLTKEEKDKVEKRYTARYGNDPNYHPDFDVKDFYKNNYQALEATGATKYHSYQLAGGENYREKLLTLPAEKKYTVSSAGGAAKDYHEPKTFNTETEAKLEHSQRSVASPNSYHSIMEHNPGYRSSHWDEPNILAHVRMNDRMIDGKKSLHIEEIQSDWHQQGRDKGYKENLSPAETTELTKLRGKIEDGTLNGDDAVRVAELENKKSAYGGVPNAPFKKSWHELALKRMIREASEKGYDALSWTPGEAQAARYDLSKQIDSLQAIPIQDQHGLKYEIRAANKSNTNNFHHFATEAELPNIVGKEMAKKIVEQTEGKHSKLFTGLDLKIGGEGMKGFYDQIIPKALEKISGEKVKMGGITPKVMQAGPQDWRIIGADNKGLSNPNGSPLSYGSKAQAEAAGKELNQVHYIDLPQELKNKAIGKGFPLFSSTHIFTPVAGNPFQQDKSK